MMIDFHKLKWWLKVSFAFGKWCFQKNQQISIKVIDVDAKMFHIQICAVRISNEFQHIIYSFDLQKTKFIIYLRESAVILA